MAKDVSERLIALFAAYIDDSGTDPLQKVTNTTALVMPAHRLEAFHLEWKAFSDKWGITDFHASVCAIAKKDCESAGRDCPKINALYKTIRQIIWRYGLKAISFFVNKSGLRCYRFDTH